MKIKTSELTGAALDWAVARALGKRPSLFIFQQTGALAAEHHYSTDWAQGGPIIEREGIFFSPLPDMGLRAFQFKDGQYLNIVDCWPYKEKLTRLVLGMRCYVASKLGDEVDVPEELI